MKSIMNQYKLLYIKTFLLTLISTGVYLYSILSPNFNVSAYFIGTMFGIGTTPIIYYFSNKNIEFICRKYNLKNSPRVLYLIVLHILK